MTIDQDKQAIKDWIAQIHDHLAHCEGYLDANEPKLAMAAMILSIRKLNQASEILWPYFGEV